MAQVSGADHRMRILISPAMTMVAGDDFSKGTEPVFVGEAAHLIEKLRAMEPEARQVLWSVSDKLMETCEAQLEAWTSTGGGWAATAFHGIQYRHLAPEVLTESQWDYLQDHLRIGSGLYGILRPEDEVHPYRLEMKTKLAVDGAPDLYGFWGDSLARELFPEGAGTLVDVASREYARAVVPRLAPEVSVVTCLFGTVDDQGRFRQRATEAKAARGDFCRWMAEEAVEDLALLASYGGSGYHLDRERSSADTLRFVH